MNPGVRFGEDWKTPHFSALGEHPFRITQIGCAFYQRPEGGMRIFEGADGGTRGKRETPGGSFSCCPAFQKPFALVSAVCSRRSLLSAQSSSRAFCGLNYPSPFGLEEFHANHVALVLQRLAVGHSGRGAKFTGARCDRQPVVFFPAPD